MFRILRSLVNAWNMTHPTLDLTELCLQLAEDRYDWVQDEKRAAIENMLNTLDGELLAFCEELGIDAADPDRIQEVIQGSLLAIQLRDQKVEIVPPQAAAGIFAARVRSIYRVHPDPSVRTRLYRLGMSLSSCRIIDEAAVRLLDLYLSAISWAEWSQERRCSLLSEIARFVLGIPDTAPESPLPAEWPMILSAWLRGEAISEIATIAEVAAGGIDCNKIGHLVEDVCGYRLPWGINGIFTYLSDVASEREEEIPRICSYFAGMVKYGVADPVAVCIAPYLDQDRKAAIAAASVCPFHADKPREIVRWVLDVSCQDLTDLGLAPEMAEQVIERRGWRDGQAAGIRNRRSILLPSSRTQHMGEFADRPEAHGSSGSREGAVQLPGLHADGQIGGSIPESSRAHS